MTKAGGVDLGDFDERDSLRTMFPPSIPPDTDPEVFAMQVARWRSMTTDERVAIVERLHADLEQLALAGIRAATPGISEQGVRHELARRRYGRALADEAYAPPSR